MFLSMNARTVHAQEIFSSKTLGRRDMFNANMFLAQLFCKILHEFKITVGWWGGGRDLPPTWQIG